MRALALTLLLILAPLTARAAGWDVYENARFGYSIEVPQGMEWGAESANGDGREFRAGAIRLIVWGGNMTEPDFETSVATDQTLAQQDGWKITYEAATPTWASFSGTNGQRILYERMITLCDSTQIAGFLLQYSTADAQKLNPVVDHLVQGLKKTGC